MRNLLNAIAGGRLNISLPDAEYKSLLSDVRDSRDQKYGDFFYDTLERVVNELKSSTENNDAAAFQKPVSRQEAPDYHEIIAHPMDLATMSKKVKQRQYKSKEDFAHDLSLIWDNCLKYNVGKDHYLRGCAFRMRAKASKLLERVSDRIERNQPTSLLTNGGSPPKQNGLKLVFNGVQSGKKVIKPSLTAASSPGARSATMTPTLRAAGKTRRVTTFADRNAPQRSDDAMLTFQEIDADLQRYMTSLRPGSQPMSADELTARMRAIIEADDRWLDGGVVEKVDGESSPQSRAGSSQPKRSTHDELMAFVNGLEGNSHSLKRKRSASANAEESRKRQKLDVLPEVPEEPLSEDPVELWWQLMRTDTMLGAGLPALPEPASAPSSPVRRKKKALELPGGTSTTKTTTGATRKTKKAKSNKSLLHLMNKNIRTLKRVQRIHEKLAIIKDGAEMGGGMPGEPLQEEDPAIYRKWKPRSQLGEIDKDDAWSCAQWSTTKILQHNGFSSGSQVALNVLTSIAEGFFTNMGKTLRFYCDKYSQTMSGEEILLHTLFEHGIPDIAELEKYITDDVVRYGSRLSDNQRKLENAYRDLTTVTAEELGDLDAEGEDFVFGNFGDELGGEDFFGFKAMGLDKELGLQSLSVPTRLWNAKKAAQLATTARLGSKEPQLPYPPPPAFVTLQTGVINDQIGLLHLFYSTRAQAALPPPPPPPPTQLVPPYAAFIPPVPVSAAAPAALPALAPAMLPLTSTPTTTPTLATTGPTVGGFSLPSSNAIPYSITTATTASSLPSSSAIPFQSATSLPSISAIPSGTQIPVPPVPVAVASLPSTAAIPYTAAVASGTIPYGVQAMPVAIHPQYGGMYAQVNLNGQVAYVALQSDTALPDEAPEPMRTKIGPLGQILQPNTSSAAAMKKKREEERKAQNSQNASGQGQGQGQGQAGQGSPEKDKLVKEIKKEPKDTKEKKDSTPKARPKKKKDPAPPAAPATLGQASSAPVSTPVKNGGPAATTARANPNANGPSPYPGQGAVVSRDLAGLYLIR
ncbi:hypothetical protein BKA62DRAFT_831355 [Auriculariales sp. MPI-PUGE-AT-0066]|nr:hypothetical protein BKA62DRAFT_831355 [Auriculariales sp. MPI-PUGE-AT-0066]